MPPAAEPRRAVRALVICIVWIILPYCLYLPGLPARSVVSAKRPGPSAAGKWRGVNFGGWLLLERWMNEAAFANTTAEAAPSEWHLRAALGDAEVSRRLRQHRDAFMTEVDFERAKAAGLTAIRLPFGYWIATDTEAEAWPFVPGHFEHLDLAVRWASQHDLKLLLDFHATPGFQSGEGHSGKEDRAWQPGLWTAADQQAKSLRIIERIAARYADEPCVEAMEVLNEPSGDIDPMDLLRYYRAAHAAIRRHMPADRVTVVFPVYPTFLMDEFVPAKAFDGMDGIALDVHLYQLFSTVHQGNSLHTHLRAAASAHADLARAPWPIIVGEFSAKLPDWSPSWPAARCLDPTRPAARAAECGWRSASDVLGTPADGHRRPRAHLSTTRLALRQFVCAQVGSFEHWHPNVRGWFFWTWKVDGEGQEAWDLREGARRGWFDRAHLFGPGGGDSCSIEIGSATDDRDTIGVVGMVAAALLSLGMYRHLFPDGLCPAQMRGPSQRGGWRARCALWCSAPYRRAFWGRFALFCGIIGPWSASLAASLLLPEDSRHQWIACLSFVLQAPSVAVAIAVLAGALGPGARQPEPPPAASDAGSSDAAGCAGPSDASGRDAGLTSISPRPGMVASLATLEESFRSPRRRHLSGASRRVSDMSAVAESDRANSNADWALQVQDPATGPLDDAMDLSSPLPSPSPTQRNPQPTPAKVINAQAPHPTAGSGERSAGAKWPLDAKALHIEAPATVSKDHGPGLPCSAWPVPWMLAMPPALVVAVAAQGWPEVPRWRRNLLLCACMLPHAGQLGLAAVMATSHDTSWTLVRSSGLRHAVISLCSVVLLLVAVADGGDSGRSSGRAAVSARRVAEGAAALALAGLAAAVVAWLALSYAFAEDPDVLDRPQLTVARLHHSHLLP